MADQSPPNAAKAVRVRRDAERREQVLAALREGAECSEAAKAAGTTRQTVYRWRQADEAFAVAYADAVEQGTEVLESVARKRAVGGSDTLLIFLLKARRPEKYRDTVRVDQTTTIRDDRKSVRAAAQRDPEAFERLARAMVEDKTA